MSPLDHKVEKGVMTPDRLESPEKILTTYVAETAMRIDEKIERKW